MQIRGEATWRRELCCFFFSQYFSLFACKTGSKIKKHVGVSTRGGVRPNGGGYDPHPSGSGRNPRQWAVHPPEYLPRRVSYISTYNTDRTSLYHLEIRSGPYQKRSLYYSFHRHNLHW